MSKVRSFRVAVVGDPNSGKSVFLSLLYQSLASLNVPLLMQEGDVTSPTQPWSLSKAGLMIRRKLKESLRDPEVIQKRLNWIVNSLKNLSAYRGVVLVDVGGGRPDLGVRVTEWNQEILNNCDFVIIVSNSQASIEAWERELKEKVPNIQILAKFLSIYNPKPPSNSPEYHLYYLDRNALIESRIPSITKGRIKKLAEKIVSMRNQYI